MTLQLINPEDLPTPSAYTHVVVATGTRMVFIAGQEPEDVHGNLVGPGDPSICRSSSGADNTCSATTSQPTRWWEWRR